MRHLADLRTMKAKGKGLIKLTRAISAPFSSQDSVRARVYCCMLSLFPMLEQILRLNARPCWNRYAQRKEGCFYALPLYVEEDKKCICAPPPLVNYGVRTSRRPRMQGPFVCLFFLSEGIPVVIFMSRDVWCSVLANRSLLIDELQLCDVTRTKQMHVGRTCYSYIWYRKHESPVRSCFLSGTGLARFYTGLAQHE
jgi:hypothetical protein